MSFFPTFYGSPLAPTPAPYVMLTNPAAILAKAAMLERLADLHLSEGRTEHADRLSHVALELRCRARGVPA